MRSVIRKTNGKRNQRDFIGKLLGIAEGNARERLVGILVLGAQDLVVLALLFAQMWDGILYPLLPAETWVYLAFYIGPAAMVLGSILVSLKSRGGIVLLLVPIIL